MTHPDIPGTYPIGGVPINAANVRQLRDYVAFALQLAREGKQATTDDLNIAETSLDMLADSCLALLDRPSSQKREPVE